MVLELPMVLELSVARTKWRHGPVMQSQKDTEGGTGGICTVPSMSRDACGPHKRPRLKSLAQHMASVWTGWFPGQVSDWLTVVRSLESQDTGP